MTGILESGFVWAPYIPLEITPSFTFNDFENDIFNMTNYLYKSDVINDDLDDLTFTTKKDIMT